MQPRTVASADGTPIAFWRSGAGRPLVLVHGTTADHTRWATVLPLLEPHFTVYAVDRRGRGGSGDSSGADAYAIEREFEDVVATVRAVREDARENPILLGHSYGGICSLEAASRIPDDIIDGLILYEPPIQVGIEIYPPGVIDRLDALIAAGEREEALMTFMREIVHVPAEQIELSRSLPSWEGRVAAAPTVAREVRADDEYRLDAGRCARVVAPVLLLHGSDSPAFLVRATEYLHEAIPHSTLHALAGQQHAAMDTAPQLFADEIVRFTG